MLSVAAAFLISANLGSVVETWAENRASELVGSRVTLGRITILPGSGKGSLSNVRVRNPKGFRTDDAMRIGHIAIDLDKDTMFDNPIVIRRVTITSLRVTYEFGFDGSNLDAIGRNIAAYRRRAREPVSLLEEWAGALKLENIRFVVRELVVRNAEIAISPRILQGASVTTDLPEIRLRGIGGGSGGATVGEILALVVEELSDGIGKSARP